MVGGKRKGGADAVAEVLDRQQVGWAGAGAMAAPKAPEIVPTTKRFINVFKDLDARRLFVLLPFAVIAGLIVYVAGESEPAPWAVAATGIVLATGLVLARQTLRRRSILMLLLATWSGIALGMAHGWLLGDPRMLAQPAYGSFRAVVDEVIASADAEQRVVISAIEAMEGSRPVTIRRARILVKAGPPLAPGDSIAGAIRFYPVPGPVLPGGYDTQFHSYFDGIGAFGNATSALVVTPPAEADFGRSVAAVRQAIGARIDRNIGGEANGIARSMMIGDQSRISDEVREAMAESGLAHIYSISGLHLSLVAIGMLTALRYLLVLLPGLPRWLSIKKLAAIGALVAACGYLLLAGGASNVPAFRSTLMIGLILGAVLAGRRALTMRNVAIAALVIIAMDPASVFRPSFQLSFAAVVALIGAYEWVRGEGDRPGGIWGWLRGLVIGTALTSLVAGLATLLFSAYHFQQTAPLGLLANLMSLILIAPIMAAIVVSTLLMPLGWEGPFLGALGALLEALIAIARLVTAWSEGLTLHPLLTPLALLLGLAALAWFAVLRSWHRLIGPALLVPAVLVFCLDRPPDVLVADTTRAVAVRGEAGLALLDGKDTSFAVTVWSETFGEPIAAATGASCDAVGCWATSPRGFSVALVEDPAGFYEDCGLADLVITRLRAPVSCKAGVVLDAAALAAGGVHWLRWRGDGFELRAARTGLERPWRAALK